jgi:glyoxylase-like metal-dependent hydrolase (beta-lactamase superfamily II)
VNGARAARLNDMVDVVGFRVGAVELTRVPYFDVALDPAVAQATAEQVQSLDWATPTWATATGQVLIGQAAWIVESQDRMIVIDPCGAADQFIRSGPEAIGHQEAVLGAIRDAGVPPERVDTVVLSHLDGIGMAAVVDTEGHWTPAFPNARIVMMAAELDFLSGDGRAQGLDALTALLAQGAVDGVDDGYELTDEVSLELVGGHSPGHAIMWIRSDGNGAAFVGHLLLNPVNVALGDRSMLHLDGARATQAIDALVADARAHETLLVGPLWPFPGAGYAEGDRITAAD